MRTLKCVIGAVIAAGLLACGGGQPRIYRIAVDPSPLGSLPPSCYQNNAVSTMRVIGTNLREETQWVIWDGVDGRQYLDLGNGFEIPLGDAEPVGFNGVIEGKDKVFSGQLVQQKLPDPGSQYTFTRTLSLVVTFTDMGGTAQGKVDASSQYTCTACTNNDNQVNCASSLTFVGRQIEADNLVGYSNQGGG